MAVTFSALLPIFALIAFGFFLKKIQFVTLEFWKGADRLTYFILMPSLLIYKLSSAQIADLKSQDFLLSGFLAITCVWIALLVVHRFFEKRAFTSVVQGALRYNTYVFLALIDGIYGDSGLILGVIFITFMIPFLNVVSILTFAIFANSSKLSIASVAMPILKNPLIIACIIGGAIGYFEISLFIALEHTLKVVSATALPLGLLSVGAALEITDLGSRKKEIILTSAIKLLLMPLVLCIIGKLLGLDPLMLSVVVLFGAMPTAPTSYILARQLGGDERLMSSLITAQTLASLLTLWGIIPLLP